MHLAKILVTGGTGFLGRHVVETLQRAGREVHSCSRREGVDLRNAAQFRTYLEQLNPDCVIHCAAHSGGITYVQEHAVEIFEDNLHIGLNLLSAVSQVDMKLLIDIMPNCTYPGDKEIYREAEWWDGPLHDSVLMYGLPRKTMWGLATTYARQGSLRCGHLVLPNLYGPGDHFDPEKSHALGALIAKVVRAKLEGESKVVLWGSGTPVREWLYAADAGAAIAEYLRFFERQLSAISGGSCGEIYNVGIGEGVSINALAEAIRNAARWDGEFVYDTTQPDGAPQKLLDGTRFAKLTGWTPATPLLEGIARTVQWYEQHLADCEPSTLTDQT